MSPDSALVCYADDTLVLIWGAAWGGAVRLAELAVACMVAAIKGFGLRVSSEKSEAMWFCRRADHGTPPAGYRLRLERAEIGVGTSMKYLGLTLDSHWTFGAHFPGTVYWGDGERIRNVCYLGWAGPASEYVGCTSAWCDRAPIWAEDLMASRHSLLKVRRLHRTVAIRVVRGASAPFRRQQRRYSPGFPRSNYRPWGVTRFISTLGVCWTGLARWAPMLRVGLDGPCSTDCAPASTWERTRRG